MHLSLEHFSSAGPAPTCLLESHREPLFPGTGSRCLWAEAADPGESCGDAAALGHCPWTEPLYPLSVSEGWTHPFARDTCQSPVSLDITLPWVIFKIPSTPPRHTCHLL